MTLYSGPDGGRPAAVCSSGVGGEAEGERRSAGHRISADGMPRTSAQVMLVE